MIQVSSAQDLACQLSHTLMDNKANFYTEAIKYKTSPKNVVICRSATF